MSEIMEKAKLRKARTTGSVWLLLLLAGMIAVFRYTNELIALLTGKNPAEIADMGPEMLQTLSVVAMHILFATILSLGVALFVERQLKENAFGTWSRFGIVFLACMYVYSQVAGGLL